MKNNQNGVNTWKNSMKDGNSKNYGGSSIFTKFRVYSRNYNGNSYNYNNYRPSRKY